MTQTVTLSRLRTLLDRVRSRSRVPMPPAAALPAAAAVAEAAPAPAELATLAPPAAPLAAQEPEVDASIDVDVDDAEATQVDVGVHAGADVGAAADASPMQRDSDERLVSATEHVPAADDAEAFAQAEERPIDLAADSQEIMEPEAIEPAPASSRRPVAPDADDQLDRMAFGAEEAPPPLHTPPPESGRLPAAAADQFDPDVAESGTNRSQTGLVPQATKAAFDASGPVASIAARPPRATPSTFAQLLDDALSL
jgi:hypothetical protein